MSELRGVVGIVGQGYVGLPLAVEAANNGWRVIGYEKSAERVISLNKGVSHVEDVPNDALNRVIISGKYLATSSPQDLVDCDYVIICVPTPLNSNNQPDLSYLKGAVYDVLKYIKPDVTLISESTSFPGTVSHFIKGILESERDDKGANILLCAAPERVDPLNEVYKMRNTPRLVSGVSKEATASALKFYSSICDNVVVVSSPLVAEFAKLLENTFRQVNIALINQITPYIRSMGVDVREVVEAAGSKPYGFMKFYPGAGPGGHCIPVDPLYLYWAAAKSRFDLTIVKEADSVNNSMAQYVCDRVFNFGDINRVLICGVSYKSNIGDIRESSAKRVADLFVDKGVEVLWYDPLVDSFPVGEEYKDGDLYDAVVLLVRHRVMDLSFLSSDVQILDCTGSLDSSNVTRL